MIDDVERDHGCKDDDEGDSVQRDAAAPSARPDSVPVVWVADRATRNEARSPGRGILLGHVRWLLRQPLPHEDGTGHGDARRW